MTKKNLLLTIVIAAIMGSIFYLESIKPDVAAPISSNNDGPVVVGDAYREIVAPSDFLNADPFELADYIGKKVILLDFMTYSCINCQRTFPYLNAWNDQYKDEGLLIVGIHTPEFDFEKELSNVQAAAQKYGLEFPLVLDNDKGTWTAYGNRYWPRKYLIDLNGNIVYDHIGEGNYEETEQEIRTLLGIDEPMKDPRLLGDATVDFDKIKSPEVYFGYQRNEFLSNGIQEKEGEQNLEIPENKGSLNAFYMGGIWDFQKEYAESKSAGKIVFNFEAKKVHMVASSKIPMNIEVWQDGELLKTVEIGEEDLYTLIDNADYGKHTLEIRIPKEGLKAFTLTFG